MMAMPSERNLSRWFARNRDSIIGFNTASLQAFSLGEASTPVVRARALLSNPEQLRWLCECCFGSRSKQW